MEITNLTGIELSEVERDSEQLPVAWPMLRVGDNLVTRSNDMPVNLKLTAADLQSMVDYHLAKGVQIPIDCKHVISNLAGKLNIDESELVKQLPRYTGVAGFGKLELRNDTLYFVEAEYLPIGREVMAAGQFRYYSPTIRGLDGKSPLRITSVALTNEPHLQNLAALSAGEDEETVTPEMVREAQNINPEREVAMTEEEKETVSEETGLLALLREILGDDVTPENLKEKLLALKAPAAADPEVENRLEKLEAAEEARERRSVVAEAFRRGKLTPAQLATSAFMRMTAAELGEYCDSVADGCAAPVGTLELGERHAGARKFTTVGEAIAAAKITPMN